MVIVLEMIVSADDGFRLQAAGMLATATSLCPSEPRCRGFVVGVFFRFSLVTRMHGFCVRVSDFWLLV